jgi:hypothetical protein
MSMHKHYRGVLLALALAGLGAAPVQAHPLSAADVDAAIQKAEAAREKAASVDGEWRDTADLIKQAQAAAKKGRRAAAVRLAEEAMHQGELGYAQAMSQKGADFPAYMR